MGYDLSGDPRGLSHRGGALGDWETDRSPGATSGDTDLASGLTRRVIGLAIEVHRLLGPGLLERVYEECLCFELAQAGVPFVRQQQLPLRYKGFDLNYGFRMDVVVDNALVLEIKSVAQIDRVHEAQLLTYMRLSGRSLGLLLNFNSAMLKDGIRRKRI